MPTELSGLDEAQTQRAMQLICKAYHRFRNARHQLRKGHTAAAAAEYFAADTEILPYLFKMLPEETQNELIQMFEDSEGEGK